MTSYTVKQGDCAWKFAKNNLSDNPTNQEIANELKRLVSIYGCKDVNEFNKKYFSKIGFSFDLKGAPKTKPNSSFSVARELDSANVDTFHKTAIKPAACESTYVAQHHIHKVTSQDSIRRKKNYTNFSNTQQEQNRINNLPSDKEKVIEWNKKFNQNNKDNYIIIDKKACMAYVYSPGGKVVKQYEIGVAKNKTDELLVRNKKQPSNNVKSTTAGIYTANYRGTGKDGYARLYNNRVLQLSNDGLREKGVGSGETGVALHQVPNGNNERIRKLKQPGVSDANNRFSDGCVNFLAEDFDDCMSHIKGVGTKVYILPEDDNNYMCVKNGKLHMAQKKYTGNVPTTSSKGDPIKKITITKKGGKIYPFDTQSVKGQMANTLSRDKERLAKDLGIDNDTYNSLAMVTLGIAGQETDYGSRWAGTKKGHPYWLKEYCPKLASFMKSIKGNNSYNSRGITQMKIQGYTDPEVQNLFKKYGINEDNLSDPAICARATMIVLSCIYKNELPALKSQIQALNLSKQDALLYCWSNHKREIKNQTATPQTNSYVQNVHKYMQDFEIHQQV